MPLFILFFLLPIVEIWLLLEVSDHIGGWPTIFLVLLTGLVGLGLLRIQGPATLMRARLKLAQGEMPASEMVEGLCLAVGGALLLTPGFVTDALGLSCLIPGLRRRLLTALMGVGLRRSGFVHMETHIYREGPKAPRDSDSKSSPQGKGQTIEGEFKRKD